MGANKNDTPVTTNNRYLILDSNVIQHFSIEGLGLGIVDNLREAARAGFDIAISDITYFELLDEASLIKEKERMDVLGKIKRFYVKKNVLIAAAHLGALYKDDMHEIKDVGDKIIAATSILTNSIIYTFNGRDYPRPFFNEIAFRYIPYTEKKCTLKKCMTAYFLTPNYNLINDRYAVRLDPINKKP